MSSHRIPSAGGLSSYSFASEVVPDTAHTRLPESAWKESIQSPSPSAPSGGH